MPARYPGLFTPSALAPPADIQAAIDDIDARIGTLEVGGVPGIVALTDAQAVGVGAALIPSPSTSSNLLLLKTLLAGGSVTISSTDNEVVITGGGEVNDTVDAGSTGYSLRQPKSGASLPIKRIAAGSGIDITDNTTHLVISSIAGAGASNAAPYIVGVQSAGGTSYTLTVNDRGKLVVFDQSSTCTLTVPANIAHDGAAIMYALAVNIGGGAVALAAASGASILSNGFAAQTTPGGVATIMQRANSDGSSGRWLAFGQLAASAPGETVQVITHSSGGVTFDLNSAQAFRVVMNADVSSITVNNAPTDRRVSFAVRWQQGGSTQRTVTRNIGSYSFGDLPPGVVPAGAGEWVEEIYTRWPGDSAWSVAETYRTVP